MKYIPPRNQRKLFGKKSYLRMNYFMGCPIVGSQIHPQNSVIDIVVVALVVDRTETVDK